MDIPKRFLTQHAITAFVLTVALMIPCVVAAVSIGEAILQSRLGEPLSAQVDLMVENNERIEDSCLSLAAPDPLQDDISNFLTEASLSLKTEGKRQYVDISSPKLFNDAFARLRLQVECPGMRSISKTLTIFSFAQTASNKQGRSASSRPKLSGEPIDESRIGKVSAEERTVLLARQLRLEANFLSLQHQFLLLQDELGEIKSQLTQSGIPPATAAATATAPSSAIEPSVTHVATADIQESRPRPAIAVKQPMLQPGNPYLQEVLFPALGLVLVILALWAGAHYYTKIKSSSRVNSQQDAAPIMKPAYDVAAAPKISMPLVVKHPSQVNSAHAPAVVLPSEASTNVAAPSLHPPLQKIEEDVTEDDSMLEEAGLYAAHGRLAKAVEILQELIKRRPSKADAWPLLLSLYSSLGKAAEFESSAREFLKYHKNSPSWNGIQALGRTLDHDNPLYADHSSHIPASPLLPDTLNSHQPIGDILMEMGILSKREILHYLDDFDPRKNGRFGGYLVARKAITLAQLDQALLQQQGVNAETKPSALPSLQDIENFLADFDPKRHGSVGEFMASRKADTPDQLSQLLQQQPSHGTVVETRQADERPPFDKVSTS